MDTAPIFDVEIGAQDSVMVIGEADAKGTYVLFPVRIPTLDLFEADPSHAPALRARRFKRAEVCFEKKFSPENCVVYFYPEDSPARLFHGAAELAYREW